MRVLIADDSVLMRNQIRKIVEKFEMEVVAEAETGFEAYEMYKKHKPDIVTMDITMPVLTGIAATKRIMDEFPKAKIIMLSALNQKKLVFTALKFGAKHYLIKPVTPQKLLEAVEKVLPEFHSNIQESQIKEAPFKIENRESAFHINIARTFTSKDMMTLKTQLSAFLVITPLVIVVHIASDIFQEFHDHSSIILKELIENAGGSISFLKA
jgi:YesN/AraC family two-component response regulator